eukprot:jgi/Botrbrau1/5161/Bobra.0172s0033.1
MRLPRHSSGTLLWSFAHTSLCRGATNFEGYLLSCKTVVEPWLTLLNLFTGVVCRGAGYWQISSITFSNLNLRPPPPSSTGDGCFAAGEEIEQCTNFAKLCSHLFRL